jgi:hypothetical protein
MHAVYEKALLPPPSAAKTKHNLDVTFTVEGQHVSIHSMFLLMWSRPLFRRTHFSPGSAVALEGVRADTFKRVVEVGTVRVDGRAGVRVPVCFR